MCKGLTNRTKEINRTNKLTEKTKRMIEIVGIIKYKRAFGNTYYTKF